MLFTQTARRKARRTIMQIDLTQAVWWYRKALESDAKSRRWRIERGMPERSEVFNLKYHLDMCRQSWQEDLKLRRETARETARIAAGGKPRNYSIMNQGR